MSPTPITKGRNEMYKDAWKVTGDLCAHPHVLQRLFYLIRDHPPIFFPWVMILNKLVRALASPETIDHWDDIIGYATLVRDYLHPGTRKDG